MNLNLYTTFLVVYKHKSITFAANQLKLSQPTVSAEIKQLEKVIGYSLFLRSGCNVEPTIAAVELANKIEQSLAILNSIEC